MKSITTISILVASICLSFCTAHVNPTLAACMATYQHNLPKLHNCLHHSFSNDDANFVLTQVQELQKSKRMEGRDNQSVDRFIKNACVRARDINPRLDFSKYGLEKPGKDQVFHTPLLLDLYQTGRHENLSPKFGTCVQQMKADSLWLTMKFCLPSAKSQNDAIYLILWNILAHPAMSRLSFGGQGKIQDVVDESVRTIFTIGDYKVWEKAANAGFKNPF